MAAKKRSEVEAKGQKGTYVSRMDGVGLGYLMPDGHVYRSGGNGFFYLEDAKSFEPDGGDGYLRAVRGLALPPTYFSHAWSG